MSMFDDIALVGSQLAGFFDEDNEQNRVEPRIPNSINVQDVAGFFNPRLHLLDGLATGSISQDSLNKYKEAKGINDLFRISAETRFTGTKKNPFETSGQAFNRALNAPVDDTSTFDAISRAKVAQSNLLKQQAKTAMPRLAPRSYSMESQQQDALIPEAFGAFDAVQMGLAKAGSAIGLKNLESNKALSAREALNRSILETSASVFTGRPSKFLLEQIQKTIPISAIEGDDLAYSKYNKVKDIFKDQVEQYQNLLAGAGTASDKTKYAQKLGDLEYMVKRLEVVTGAFEQAGYGAEPFYDSPDTFAGEFTSEDLTELEDYFGK